MTVSGCALGRAVRPLLLGLSVLVVLLTPGCGDSTVPGAGGTEGRAVVVDARAGRVGDVRLGDPPSAAAATFGPGRDDLNLGGDPLGVDPERIGSPFGYSFPFPCDESPRVDRREPAPDDYGISEVSYRGAGATFCRRRAFILLVTSRGSATTAGARIGQSLDDARRAHPTLRCDTSTGATAHPERPVYEYCAGRVATGRYLWLGQDPVSSIAVSTIALR
jgi:hypothetical protein